ncbi:MAG TPA: hypothetical protein VF256_02895 [Streptosporangiaceae bacterium]
MGWTQSSVYAQVRALASGTTQIDRWQWETGDKAWVDGHFYSVKAPGLAAVTLPAYLGLDAIGGKERARDAAATARRSSWDGWRTHQKPPFQSYGFSRDRARHVEAKVANTAAIVWALTLLGAVLPAIGLLFMVRWVAERIEPGYGAAAAITLGVGTIVMTFASEYFDHIASAALGFAAFVLLFKEREGSPRLALVAAAGLMAGLAVCFEYPLGLLGIVLFGYALARGPRLRRGATYAGAAVAGAAPALLYNLWSLGSPLRFAYSDAVAVPGRSGHAVLGLNSDGFFGITTPRPGAAVDLLLSGRGLLTLTPVLVMGLVGAAIMRRSGRRAEAWVIFAAAAIYFLYNMAYWQPLGGGTPGPRFLIPVLPFLAVGLAPAFRHHRAVTLGLAIASGTMMVAGALTYPLVGGDGIAIWAQRLVWADLEHTVLTPLGITDPWLAIAPVLAALAAAIILAARATPRAPVGAIRPAILALLAWGAASIVTPSIAGELEPPLGGGAATLGLVGLAAGASALALLIVSYLGRRSDAVSERQALLKQPMEVGDRA